MLLKDLSGIVGSGSQSQPQSEIFSGSTSIGKLIVLIILCVVIIVACYYTTKFVGRKQLGRYAKSNFKNIDIYRINGNKYLQIIQVGNRYFCISVSKDNISVIAELNKEDIVNWPPEAKNTSFKEVLSNISGKKKDGAEKTSAKDFPIYINTESEEIGGGSDTAPQNVETEEKKP